jgi:hypothetical protein
MKNVSLIFCFSFLMITIGGNIQAFDMSTASAPDITTQRQQTLIVVFGANEGVFTQSLATSVDIFQPITESSHGSSATNPEPQASGLLQEAPAVPESATLMLVGLGLLGLLGLARQKR